MYRLTNSPIPTARLTEGGLRRWMGRSKRDAQYRVLIKRRLRRTCRDRDARLWCVVRADGAVLMAGAVGPSESNINPRGARND